jgi:prepilin-type N-terminal cleavage/methylation domain-containing protein
MGTTPGTNGRRGGGRHRRRRRGFTLVEAITAMALVATLGSVSSMIIYTGITGYRDAAMRAQLHTEISAAFDRVTRALWSMGRNTSASVVAPNITSVTATSMTWDTNWSLSLSGTQLMLSEAGATARPILNNVTSFSVQCYDESNTALAASLSGAATQAVRRIQLQATVSRHGQAETLRTRVFVRACMSGAAVGS